MVRRVFGAVVLAAVVVAAQVAAQDAVTIKTADPKAGDRVRVTDEENSNTVTKFTVGGQAQEKVEQRVVKRVYVDEVITPGGPGQKPAKVMRKYESDEVLVDGKMGKAALDGKTVVIEKKGDKYEFTADGKAVTGKALADLNQAFNQGGKVNPKTMLPAKPVKPGETWVLDGKKMFADAPLEPFEVDPAKVEGTGKLVKAYQKDGRQYGVIEYTVKMPIKGLGPKNPLTLKDGSVMTMKTTGDGCIDGTTADGTTAQDVTVKILGSAMGVDIEVTAESKGTKKQEVLPRK